MLSRFNFEKFFFSIIAFMMIITARAFASDKFEIGTGNFCDTPINSAEVGDQLLHLERDWKRYDDSNNNISFGEGADTINYNSFGGYLTQTTRLNSIGAYLEFNFVGTKIRIIGTQCRDYDDKTKIIIDGIPYIYSNNNNPGIQWQTVLFEKTGLSNKQHSVKIIRETPYTGNLQAHVDAIDIDENGELKPYNSDAKDLPSISLNINLLKLTPGQEEYLEATITPKNESNRKVIWELSNPDTAVLYSDGGVICIRGLKEGTATITARIQGEKNLSDTCLVTVIPSDTDIDKERAILEIKMKNGSVKEYNLSAKELEEFMSWFTSRSNRSGKVYYIFTNKSFDNTNKVIKECIIFDKISSFKVKEYNKLKE